MPNRAYASVWVRDFSEENMLSHFEHFLATVPLSATPPDFTGLTIRAINPANRRLRDMICAATSCFPQRLSIL